MNKADPEKMALDLMRIHGLLEGANPYRFSFNHARREFGSCNTRKRLILLSAELTKLNSEDHARDTILHEIAHALVPDDGHGIEWQRKAIEIGCDGKARDDDTVIVPQKTYEAVCSFCGAVPRAYRKKNALCGNCDSVYNPKYQMHYRKVVNG